MSPVVFWPQLFGCWSPGTRSLCAEGALSGHVAPLSHTDHPMIVIFEKQREKRVKPIMRQWVATHSVRSQWTRPWWAPSAHPEAIKAACAKHPRPRRFISACWNVLIQNDPQRLKIRRVLTVNGNRRGDNLSSDFLWFSLSSCKVVVCSLFCPSCSV